MSFKIFKPRLHNVLSIATNIVNKLAFSCLIACARFARYCGEMYSHHLFFLTVDWPPIYDVLRRVWCYWLKFETVRPNLLATFVDFA